MPVLNTGLATPARGFTIDYSCRFDGTTAYFSRTPASAGNLKTYTCSVWVKRGNVTGYEYMFGAYDASASQIATLNFDIGEYINWHTGGASNYRWYTTAQYRDPSAWYHIVFSCDTSTAGGRAVADMQRIYVNGEVVTVSHDRANPIADYEGLFNADTLHTIGRNAGASDAFVTGTMAEVHWIDGTALTASDFGETGDYGEWKPKEVSGLTYGTNGYYLDFADSSALGNDVSGNNNDWTANNLDASDQMLDTPTNNFATWNPLSGSSSYVKTEGNLGIAYGGAGWLGTLESTLGMTSGKWYWEVNILIGDPSSSERVMLGIANPEHASFASNHIGNTSGSYSLYNLNGEWFSGTSSSSGSYGTYTDGDIMQFAYNADTGTLWIGKDNTWLNSATEGEIEAGTTTNSFVTGLTGTWLAGLTVRDNSSVISNFGQDSSFAGDKTAQGNADGNGYGDFYYTPPSGFLALCTANLDTPAVTPSEHFNTVLYTGNNTADTGITGVGFQPDWTYIKSRSSAGSSNIYDAVRTVSAGGLTSNSAAAEYYSSDQFTSFDSDGFTLPADTAGYSNVNTRTYVAWNWKANGSGSANTEGSRTATVSANVDAGFSIVGFEGESGGTVGHGLSKAPEIVIMKNRDATDDWNVRYGLQDGTSDYMKLSGREGKTDSAIALPSATLINLGTAASEGGQSGEDYIAYCFHSVEGFSKCGVYTGNNSTDGTFAYTGFRPAWIMIKRTHSWAGDWHIHDTKRNTYNLDLNYLLANEAESEATSTNYSIDILSNGFKCRSDHAEVNDLDGGTNYYIYLAFAETPFKYSNAR